MYNGTHYGEPVKMYWFDENENGLKGFTQMLKSKGIEFTLLPICCKNAYWCRIETWERDMEIIQYFNDEKEMFCIIWETKSCYFLIDRLPIDMDIPKLVNDVYNQCEKKEEPVILQSKFEMIFKDAWFKALTLNEKNELSEEEKHTRSLYYQMVKETITDEEIKEWYGDYLEEEIDEDPVEEIARSLFEWKLTADFLTEKNYDYEYMKFIAELDHHDVSNYERDLERLYHGYHGSDELYKFQQDGSRSCSNYLFRGKLSEEEK